MGSKAILKTNQTKKHCSVNTCIRLSLSCTLCINNNWSFYQIKDTVITCGFVSSYCCI